MSDHSFVIAEAAAQSPQLRRRAATEMPARPTRKSPAARDMRSMAASDVTGQRSPTTALSPRGSPFARKGVPPTQYGSSKLLTQQKVVKPADAGGDSSPKLPERPSFDIRESHAPY